MWTTWVIVAVILLMVISTYNMFPNYKDQESWRAAPFPCPSCAWKGPCGAADSACRTSVSAAPCFDMGMRKRLPIQPAHPLERH